MAREKWDNARILAEIERDKRLRQYKLGGHQFTMPPMPRGAKVDVQYSAEKAGFEITAEQDGQQMSSFVPSEALEGSQAEKEQTMQRMIEALMAALEDAAAQKQQKDGKGGQGESKQKKQKKQEDKQQDKDEWWQVLQTNLTGVFHTAGYP